MSESIRSYAVETLPNAPAGPLQLPRLGKVLEILNACLQPSRTTHKR
jgi:hypothetical protein